MSNVIRRVSANGVVQISGIFDEVTLNGAPTISLTKNAYYAALFDEVTLSSGTPTVAMRETSNGIVMCSGYFDEVSLTYEPLYLRLLDFQQFGYPYLDSTDNFIVPGGNYSNSTAILASISSTDSSVNWAQSYSSNGPAFYNVTKDSSGNIYAAGYQSSVSPAQGIVVKFNSTGTILWQESLANTAYVIAYGIAVDNSGNVYVNGTLGPNPSFKQLFTKLDSSGNILWQKLGVGSYGTSGSKIIYDKTNNYIYTLAGTVIAQISRRTYQAFIVTKWDTSGNVVWQKAYNLYKYTLSGSDTPILIDGTGGYSGTGEVEVYDMVLDAAGNIYLTGCYFYYTSDSSTPGTNIMWTAKVDSSGNIVWQKNLASDLSPYSILGYSISLDSQNNVYVAGWRQTDAGTFSSNPTQSGVVVKYDNNGNLQWSRYIASSTGTSIAYSVKIDSLDNVCVFVDYQNYTNYENYNSPILIAKLKSDGSSIGSFSLNYSSVTTANIAAITPTVSAGPLVYQANAITYSSTSSITTSNSTLTSSAVGITVYNSTTL